MAQEKREIEESRGNIIGSQFGNSAVILTVKMPYSVFKKKAASERTKERIIEFEKAYRNYIKGKKTFFTYVNEGQYGVWEYFREVQLTNVEQEYIEFYELV